MGKRQSNGSPAPGAERVAPEWRGKIVHASIIVGGSAILGADVRPEGYDTPRGFFLLLGVPDVAIAERVFHAFAEGGVVSMPLQKTFWSPAFGVVVDAFGVPWEINAG